MTRTIFVISDTHFNHDKVLTFRGLDGEVIRPGFRDVHDMNEVIINNWNHIVKPNDVIYHLGDVAFAIKQRDSLAKIMPRLMGRKRLILGNHDYEAKDYYPYFEKVMSWRQFGTDMFKRPVVLTHFPLHESSFAYREGGNGINVHGHIHEKDAPTINHRNVSVEQTGYKPVAIEELI